MKLKSLTFISVLLFTLQSFGAVLHFYDHPQVKQPLYHVQLEYQGFMYEAEPYNGHQAFLTLETKDAKTHKIVEIEDSIEVTPWMPSMGHGSVPTVIEKAQDSNGKVIPGTYKVSKVYFVMEGDWVVRITLQNKQGQKETKLFSLNLVDTEDAGKTKSH